jgi:hypothetical protein
VSTRDQEPGYRRTLDVVAVWDAEREVGEVVAEVGFGDLDGESEERAIETFR